MRSTLFRGKRVEYGEWVYGYLIGDDVIVGNIVEFNDEYFNTSFWYKVRPETVGERTGLTDRNGVEIYEGDIVEHRSLGGVDKGPWIGEVTISPTQGVKVGAWPISFDYVVIGNKYEHPELLERNESA